MSHKSLHKEMKTQEAVKPEHFCARFDEMWEVMKKKCDKTKGYELRVINRKTLSNICSFEFLSASLTLEERMLLSSEYGMGNSHMRV